MNTTGIVFLQKIILNGWLIALLKPSIILNSPLEDIGAISTPNHITGIMPNT